MATIYHEQDTDPGVLSDQKIAVLEARVAQQEAKLAQKNEVIAELLEENVRAQKSVGEL